MVVSSPYMRNPFILFLSSPLAGVVAGFMSGFLSCILLSISIGATPGAMRNHMRQSALRAGVGRWVLDTNGIAPFAKFEWVTQAVPLAQATNALPRTNSLSQTNSIPTKP